ncbi:DUF1440 domain-containing protein [Sphingomonas sp. ASV193]|uniref:DUF1440 domain-containing protein n=1 Tax=Sphingomonas sp. ASV193 TaxID=3144405 RepID=UPI0032E87DC5
MEANGRSAWKGAAAGLAGGLVASFAMDRFQALWARQVDMPKGGDPATVRAAQKVSRAATGEYVAKANKQKAGQVVHYLFGAALGTAYGLVAEYRPGVTKGFGSRFALAAATAFDELAVPAAGLGTAPTEAPAKSHAYGYVSHLVFGGVTEGVRRLLRRR